VTWTRLYLFLAIASGTCFAMLPDFAAAQDKLPERPEFAVVLKDVYPPVYPPLAHQARIGGDVTVQVQIRKDGTVKSAEILTGHPMLKEAAQKSALKSTFECEAWSSGVYVVGCPDSVPPFTLTYTFGTRDDWDGLDCSGPTLPRAARCFYLWRCGAWRNPVRRTPTVGHTSDHVMILVDRVCWEPETSR
jgi:TonB family protein